MTLGDISVPFLVAVVAFVTALASLAGRARDKATIVAYKDNAAAQDITIRNQGTQIDKLQAEVSSVTTKANVLERTVNSGEKIDAQTEKIDALVMVVSAGNEAIDRHAVAAEDWWSTLHGDLETQTKSITALTLAIGADRRLVGGSHDPERRQT